MRVLHLIPSLKKGGAERLCLDICRQLNVRTGVETRLILLHPQNDYSSLSKGQSITAINSYFSYHILKASKSDFKAYDQILREFRPDIIHTHLFEAEFFSRERIDTHAVYFSHLHDHMIQFENLSFKTIRSKRKIMNLFEKRRLLRNYKKCPNYFIANSSGTYSYFEKTLDKKLLKNLRLLPNAVDLLSFPFQHRNLPVSKIHLINTGSFIPKKKQVFLIEVIRYLRSGNHPVHLHLLGDGPETNSVLQKIKKENLTNDITLYGNVDDVSSFLSKAQLYVHAATYEPFGLAILEAMATGLPVVCLDGGGNRELIEDGKNGFILMNSTPEKFAEKILEIVSNDETYQAFSRKARATAEKYDMKDYVNRLLLLYEEALKNRDAKQ